MITRKGQGTSSQIHLTTGEKNERQTKLTWATPISSFLDVPDLYKEFFQPLQKAGKPFPKTVLTPTYEGYIHPESEKLLCILEDSLYILKKSGASFETCCLPFAGIFCTELRSILLDSSIFFYGYDLDNTARKEYLRFNTISDYLFKPFIRQVRQCSFQTGPKVDLSHLEELIETNIKFASYCRHSLLPGEKIVQMIWQPEIKFGFLKRLSSRFRPLLIPSHVIMLTDYEIITIHESAPQTVNDKYGGIWHFMPLKKIQSLILKEQQDNLYVLEITLSDGTILPSSYLPTLSPQLDELLEKFNSLNK